MSPSRVDASPFALVAVVDVLVNGLAFLLVQLGRVGSGEFVEDILHRCVDDRSGALLLSPVEYQLRFLQVLEQHSSDLLDFHFLGVSHVKFRLGQNVEQGKFLF